MMAKATRFEAALIESTQIAERIRKAIGDADPRVVMLSLADLQTELCTKQIEELLGDD